MEQNNFFESRTDLSALSDAVNGIRQEIGKIIVGQKNMVDLLVASVLANSHVLIEGVPGVAKTLTARLLSKSLDVPFSRIQFTPDLMPSDVLGTSVFNPRDASFEFRPGPIFSNIVLIDEINRAPAKTQSALFEVMEERQVTIDGRTYPMSSPFIVVATQNPVEHEGTYRLPEAQLDRFLFKIHVPYPTPEEEVQILNGHHRMGQASQLDPVNKILDAARIAILQQQVRNLLVDEKLIDFITKIVTETRNNKSIFLGASPRASIGVLNGAKAIAAMRGRDFVTPEDILFVVPPVLRHRIVLTPDREMEGLTPDDVIQQIVQGIEVPR
ncbi:MAG TPA: MoxR family ATPase [Chitinophagaceae bacterium]|nr:MoxR family ATPase [Chitinophagaceae bacterium]